MTPIRPRFLNPPLIERAISVAFEPIADFSLGDLGLFWSEIRAQFPVSEAMDPIALELEDLESFKPKQSGIQLVESRALPRAAFRNSERGELIQIQPDRFGFNWIKTSEDHEYPHSEETFRRFFELFDKFVDYLDRRGLSSPKIVQCELINVNVILVSDVGQTFSDIATVLRFAQLDQGFANVRLEHQLIGSKHLIIDDEGKRIGRVHALGQPALKVPTNEEAYRLDIIARGPPLGDGADGAQKFFELAVSAVNAVFLSSSTSAGKRFWGEEENA